MIIPLLWPTSINDYALVITCVACCCCCLRRRCQLCLVRVVEWYFILELAPFVAFRHAIRSVATNRTGSRQVKSVILERERCFPNRCLQHTSYEYNAISELRTSAKNNEQKRCTFKNNEQKRDWIFKERGRLTGGVIS